MKRIISLLIFLAVLLGVTPTTFSVAEAAFSDVPTTAWYHDAVIQAADLGYFAGTGNGNFSPDICISRAMLVTVLAKASGDELSKYREQAFKDVTSDAWYFEGCNWASEKGLVTGVGDGYYAPNAKLNREQFCVVMSHFRDKFGDSAELQYDYTEFDDDGAISQWAYDYVHTLRQAGAILSRVDNYFVPKATVTRADFAVTLLSCMGMLDNLPEDPQRHIFSISVTPSLSSVEEQKNTYVDVKFMPEDAHDKGLALYSSDESIATVDAAGNVYAKKPGKVTVTAVATDGGLSASCEITVTKKPEPKPEPKPQPQPIGGIRTNLDPNKPMIALTFDDGPHPTYSNQILNILEQYASVATFFEQGMNVDRYPDVVRREAALGCELGSHSYNHPQLTKLSYSQIRNQMDMTNQAFYKACGRYPTVMRPPYGSRNASVDSAVGLPLIIWSVDTLDWKYRDANYVYNYVINHAYDGAIVLMHSIHGTTAQAMQRIVPKLISMGYQLVTVSELGYYRGSPLKAGQRYYSFQ
ncbi:MAG: polysaccharide deacetylase family protein [Clostridia bacterium]|nr:polysaccharide deacetylase family protein [Clostridia bacterium]